MVIRANGAVIAASKSCTIEINTGTNEVASESNGDWEHHRTGRKSWSITTNHIVETPQGADGLIITESKGNDNATAQSPSRVVVGSTTDTSQTRGMTIYYIVRSSTGAYTISETSYFDTFGDSQSASNTACANMVTDLAENAGNADIIAIVTYDAFGMTQALANAIASHTGADMSDIATGRDRAALCVIGDGTKGIVSYKKSTNWACGNTHAEAWLTNGNVVTATPVKDSVDRIGQVFDITCQVDGFPYDRLSGSAICKQWRGTFTRGNLAQGSYSFLGSGPLE